MAYNSDIRSVAQLTGTGRAVFEAAYGRSPLAVWFPLVDRPTRDIRVEQTNVGGEETATKLVQHNTTAPRGDSEAPGRIVYGRTGRTAEQSLIDEVNLVASPSADQLGEWMDNKARTLATRVANRLRLMTGELLATGKVSPAESGVAQPIDFHRPARTKVSLSSDKSWKNAASTPIDDLIEWRELTDGSDTLLIPAKVFNALRTNKSLIAQVAAVTPAISAEDVRMVLAAEGFNVVVLDGRDNNVKQYDGTPATVLPTDTAFLLPPSGGSMLGSALGEVQVAPTVESENPSYGIAANERPGLFVGAFHQDDPEGWAVRAAAEFLPVLRTPGAIVSAKMGD